MRYILINYNFTPDWIDDYTDDYLIYDRSESPSWLEGYPEDKVIRTPNIGNVDYDKLGYLIDNYDNLPDVFVLSKSNLFKSISEKEFNEVKDNKVFTPLLTKYHRTYSDKYGVVCYYDNGLYYERNDDWFLGSVPAHHISTWDEWAKIFDLPNPFYIPFFPGGNCILTKETVHKYPKEYYEKMRGMLGWTMLPGEAQCAERSYYLMWK